MNKLFIPLALLFTTASFAQEHTFKPNWKKGDEKVIKIEIIEKDFQEGELQSEESSYQESTIKVMEVNDDAFIVEVSQQNEALEQASEIFEDLPENIQKLAMLKLKYSISKENGKSELLNWEEARDFMNTSFDMITTALTEGDSASESAGGFLSLIFSPLREIFESKENIEAMMEDQIAYFTIPFQRTYTVGEKITETESVENPLNPAMQLSSTTHTTLKEVNEKNESAQFDIEVELDMTEFKAMMKDMMMKMAEKMSDDGEGISEEDLKEIEALDMNLTTNQKLTLNTKTGWITQVVVTAVLDGVDPRTGKRRNEAVSTITIE